MKSLHWLLSTLFLFISVTAMNAQVTIGGGAGDAVTMFAGVPGLKGAPFSADVSNETIRALSDGNRIHRETHGKTFRDSEGRTRNEMETEFPSRDNQVRITISDPVGRTLIFLDPQKKTAIVNHFRQLTPNDHAVAQLPRAALSASHTPPTREDLGTKEIEGFTVKGTRVSNTMEAGQIGNEQPIVSVHETWFSSDLKTDLLVTRDDPQSGKTTRRLTNIHAGEPDPQLFQIPADYTIKDNPLEARDQQ